MDKPDSIPQDIWDAANKLSAAIADDSGWLPSADVFDQIVSALLEAANSERQKMTAELNSGLNLLVGTTITA